MENFHNISKFIKENDLELFTDVSDDLICIICKRIMTNATSAPCRCRYCYECIKQYLNGKTKLFCPGSAKYCKIDILDFQRDIHVDSTINSRISKLIVKCPQKACEFKSELNLIKDHIEICDKRFVDCPYLQLGCSKEDVQLNNMTPHLYEDSFIHNKLLIEYINNFKNDVEILKNNMKTITNENVTLKEEIINNNLNAERKELKLNEIIKTIQNENKTMKEEINNLLSENEKMQMLLAQNNELKKSIVNIEEKQITFNQTMALLNSGNKAMKNNMISLYSEIKVIKSMQENDNLRIKCDKIEENQTKLNEKTRILVNENDAMKSQIDLLQTIQKNDDLRMKCEKIEENQREIETKIDKLNEVTEKNSINTIRRDIKYIEDNVDTIIENISYLRTMKMKEFVWKIENLSKIIETSKIKTDNVIYSDSFETHLNGYKICLYACPNGFSKSKGYFGVFFKLMMGPYDDILPWPCKINLTIQLINQNSGAAFLSRERKYENNSNNEFYQKPLNIKSKGSGYSHLIKLSELQRQTDLIRDNQLFIKCITNILE